MGSSPISRRRFGAFATGALSAVAVVRAPAKAAQFEFKCASDNPTDHPTTVPMRQMWAAIEQESGGRMHVEFYPNSQLGSSTGLMTQLRAGALQFQIVGIGFLASIMPSADIGFLGFTYKDQDEGLHVMDGPLGDYLHAESAAKGIIGLRSAWTSGMYQIATSARAIHTPDDLRGQKIRVGASRISVDLFKDLGAVPTPLTNAETYPALQTKVVDGVAVPLASIYGARFYEVQKYISLTNHAFNGLWVITSQDTWKSLPPDLQAIIERNNTKYALMNRDIAKKMNVSAGEAMAKAGLAVNTVDQSLFRARLHAYFTDWQTTFGPKEWDLLQSSLGRKLT